jgi:hypothetical protein
MVGAMAHKPYPSIDHTGLVLAASYSNGGRHACPASTNVLSRGANVILINIRIHSISTTMAGNIAPRIDLYSAGINCAATFYPSAS